MRKILAVVAMFIIGSLAGAETINQKISFDGLVPQFAKAGEYQSIKLAGLNNYGKPGAPWLPVKTTHVLLPYGAIISRVSCQAEYRDIPGKFDLIPSQKCVPISEVGVREFIEDETIYSGSSEYPIDPIMDWHQANAGGYNLVGLVVCPFRYLPSEGRLRQAAEVEISITYTQKASKVAPFSGFNKSWIEKNAINHELSELWYPAAGFPKSEGYDLLIATSLPYDTIFQRLADWKDRRGIRTKVAVLDTIYPKYAGRDLQEKLRNFIIDQYQARGISRLLLGGDYGIVPARTAFAMHSGYENSSHVGIDSLICDLYYGDLDGDWDYNGNGIFGEQGDSVDMYPEISVGRAPVANLQQAASFVDKILLYENNPPEDYLNRASFWASYMDVNTDAAAGKSLIDRDYMIDYFRPVEKLYQSTGTENPAGIIQAVNQGRHLINHNGHSGFYKMQGGDGWLDTLLMDTLSNSGKWGILYSQGCQAAGFDSNCIAEHFVNNPQGGGLAFIGNSRYGWYIPYFSGYGPSDLYDNTFFENLLIEGTSELGKALAYSKADLIPLSRADEYFRWVNYDLNLLGDPTLSVWTSAPESLEVVCPDTINIGSFILPVYVLNDGAPLGGATVTLRVDSACILSFTDRAGQAFVPGTTAYTQNAILTVWAENCIPFQKQVAITVPSPRLSYAGSRWAETTGNSDGLPNPGESGSLEILIKNTGNFPSGSNAELTMRSKDNRSDVSDSLADISGLMPGDSVWTSAYPKVTFDSLCNDSDVAQFEVDIVDSAGNKWSYRMGVNIYAPAIEYTSHAIIDSILGNGNGCLEAGETSLVKVYLKNTGHASSRPGAFHLSSSDVMLNLISPDDSLGIMAPGSLASLEFSITADSALPDSALSFMLKLDGVYGDRSFSDSFLMSTGITGMDDDMENGADKWDVSGTSFWHISTVKYHSSSNSWYFGDEMTGTGPVRAVDTLETRSFKLAPFSTLRFWQWYDLVPGWTYGYIELQRDSAATLLEVLSGSSGQWEERSYDLSKYSDGQSVKVRFIANADSSGIPYQGWFIDDLRVGQEYSGTNGDADRPLVRVNNIKNIPNPFGIKTRISFGLATTAAIELSIYNIAGQKIKKLTRGELLPGNYEFIWDGSDDHGQRMPSGIYFARLETPGGSLTKRMIMVK